LIAQVRLETVVQQAEPLQLKMFSEHYRPRDETKNRETEHDDFVDRSAALEDFDDVGGGEDG
jgi:hypothetical protein